MEQEKKKDIIDRHSKKRAILIDEDVLFNSGCQDYMHELIDIAEISDYYDCIILTKNNKKVQKYVEHWSLHALVYPRYKYYDEMKKTYRFLLLFCTKKNIKHMKDYYKCEILMR
ncbi:MAG: hypothetical protein IJ122_06255 [Methanobrevibacter sp.]|nr:hypothetical protein [Methanobrevibacter sp.]